MTAKEWAKKCMDALDQNSPDCSVSETIELYIEKAVREERERVHVTSGHIPLFEMCRSEVCERIRES